MNIMPLMYLISFINLVNKHIGLKIEHQSYNLDLISLYWELLLLLFNFFHNICSMHIIHNGYFFFSIGSC